MRFDTAKSVIKIDETLQFALVLYYIELPTNGETTETTVQTLFSHCSYIPGFLQL